MDSRSQPYFSLAPVTEVYLPRAPLAKVVTQVQFSRTPSLVSPESEAMLVQELHRYPVQRQGLAAGIAVTIGSGPGLSVTQPALSPMRLFAETSGVWQVTITETSVALETTGYQSKDDFCDRAEEVLTAITAIATPPVVDRVGIRYIDRLSGADLSRLAEYVLPQLRVLYGAVGDGLSVEHSVSDTLIRVGNDEGIQVRSGLLPPNGAFDAAVSPLPEPAWLLDIDVFTVHGGFAFDPSPLASRLRTYADHAYSFFRYATTDTFQSDFGHAL